MRRSSGIIQVGTKSNDKCSYESEANRDYRQKSRRRCAHEGRDCSDVATSQGMPAATKSCKRQTTDSFLVPPERLWSYKHLIPDVWPSEL